MELQRKQEEKKGWRRMHRFVWMWKYVVAVGLFVAWGVSGCQCDPPIQPDGSGGDGIVQNDGSEPTDGQVVGPDGKIVNPDGTTDEPEGCPPSWTVTMEAKDGATELAAVFCPAPTLDGCQSLQAGPQCAAADTPLILFTKAANGTTFVASHSGSIEKNSHGDLKPSADATMPDLIENLPQSTKITALFSGVSISFELKGDDITVYAPQ